MQCILSRLTNPSRWIVLYMQGGTLCAMRVVYLPSVHIPSMCIVGRLYLQYMLMRCMRCIAHSGRKEGITMKKAFFRKVVAEGIAMTGRYLYEYDQKKKAIHVTDSKGVVDKWVTLADCEPDTTPAPKAKATPAPKEETVTLTKGELSAIIAQAVAQAMAGATPAAAPAPKAATPVKATPAKAKSVRKTAEPDNKYSRTNKADLSKSTQQVWDAIKKAIPAATIVAYGSWLYITGTVKEDWATLKQFGCRWSRRRNCAYFVGELAA